MSGKLQHFYKGIFIEEQDTFLLFFMMKWRFCISVLIKELCYYFRTKNIYVFVCIPDIYPLFICLFDYLHLFKGKWKILVKTSKDSPVPKEMKATIVIYGSEGKSNDIILSSNNPAFVSFLPGARDEFLVRCENIWGDYSSSSFADITC